MSHPKSALFPNHTENQNQCISQFFLKFGISSGCSLVPVFCLLCNLARNNIHKTVSPAYAVKYKAPETHLAVPFHFLLLKAVLNAVPRCYLSCPSEARQYDLQDDTAVQHINIFSTSAPDNLSAKPIFKL